MKKKQIKVFSPNATSNLIVEDTVKLLKKGKHNLLDLGCGNGFIGLNIYKKRRNKINAFCFSDISKEAVSQCINNAKKNNLKIIAKTGSMFGPWKGKKFDFIVESVSAIAKQVADLSPWYNKNISYETGDDGTFLVNKILKNAKTI